MGGIMLLLMLPCQGQTATGSSIVQWWLGWLEFSAVPAAAGSDYCQDQMWNQSWGSLFPVFGQIGQTFLFVCLFLFCLCLLMVLGFQLLLCPVWEHMEDKKRKPRTFHRAAVPHVLRFLAVRLLVSAIVTLSAYFQSSFIIVQWTISWVFNYMYKAAQEKLFYTILFRTETRIIV